MLAFVVTQRGYTLYRVDTDNHRPTVTAGPYVDPEGLDPPIPPSGPTCDAELPRRLQIASPDQGADLRLRYDDDHPTEWNPPLQPNLFTQNPRAIAGLVPKYVGCDR